ncbi:MAG: preprotein translocase subunit SecE [Candidatus Kerfeldbacteria bacterium]|nr:preprotein translocase subunit SecE [Candidatus Kerfeldbacteria bacterium]
MPNFIVTYLKASLEELKKVVWPSKRETLQHTLIVVGLSLVLALFLGAIDYLLNLGLQELIARR